MLNFTLNKFWDRVSLPFDATDEDCWEWIGTRDKDGYGILPGGAKYLNPEKAHRLSYEHYKGKIPEDYSICHKCDNKRCINPSHLFAGTPEDNFQDRVDKGQIKVPPSKKDEIFKLYEQGLLQREIGERLNVSQSYITIILKKNKGYQSKYYDKN